jgi:hypothetical protein
MTMRLEIIAFFTVLLSTVPALSDSTLPPLSDYVGSEKCGGCHVNKHEQWQMTYHSSVFRDLKEYPEAVLGDFGQEDIGFKLEEVSHIIGGHWYQRYVKKIGENHYVLPKVWSVASQKWETQDSWSWMKKPYETYCIGCHTTRYDPDTRQYAEQSVSCESCHGPGKEHADSNGAVSILNPATLSHEERSMICASCHVRGTDKSGKFKFAAGYIPGRNLEDYYTPAKMNDNETPREAFLRIFDTWALKVANGGAPAACGVCGIGEETLSSSRLTISEQCIQCHKYKDYDKHTRHAGDLKLQCLECHHEISEAKEGLADVHTPVYFMVHRTTTYSKAVVGACIACHEDRTAAALTLDVKSWSNDRRGVDKID